MDYKNADAKVLRENLKNKVQGLLREGIYDEVAPVQGQQVQPAKQEVDKLAATYDYTQYIGLLNQMIQQADGTDYKQ